MVDIEPAKLNPTWRNKKVSEDRIAKTLYRFMVAEHLADSMELIRQWVAGGEDLDHSTILLELTGRGQKPPSPFKFNVEWIKDESYVNLVKSLWISLDPHPPACASISFVENLKRVKQASIIWAKEKKERDECELRYIESLLLRKMQGDGGGFISEEEKEYLTRLEKRILLDEKEAVWRLKSRTIWLNCGEENTKKFQTYVHECKLINTIWSSKMWRERL